MTSPVASTSHPALPPDPYPSSEQPQRKPNPHGAIYKSGGAGRAIAYNFLIAMVTFQVLYWGWMKLESLEVKKEKDREGSGVNRLEAEAKIERLKEEERLAIEQLRSAEREHQQLEEELKSLEREEKALEEEEAE